MKIQAGQIFLLAAALAAQVVCEGSSSPLGIPRELVRERVDPVRVVWASEGSVTGATTLLKPKSGQVPETSWKWEHMTDGCCVMTNGGATVGLILDFGRELHGGLRIAASARSAKGMRMRVRFGESVSETMSELGERGACNDHAIRDSVIDLPFMGTREIGNTGFRFVRLDLVTPGYVTLESVRAEKKGDGTLAVSVTAPDWVKVVQMADSDCESAPEDGGLWPDDKGIHINAHGGGVMWHEGRYYWYGEHKGRGMAGNVAHGAAVHCYSSADLRRWKEKV